MAVVEVRRSRRGLGYEELASAQGPGGIDVFDPFEANQDSSRVGPGRGDNEVPGALSTRPQETRARRQSPREARDQLNGELSGKTVRPTHRADDEHRNPALRTDSRRLPG